MRRGQRYTVHRRLLLTFLLLGCAGSFVLGQEMARALATIPVYAAQSLTFSGAGITASLVTPLQATGSIGQPTPQPKVVQHPNKPANKPKGKGPTTTPVAPPQPAPAKSPPIVLQGIPVAVLPTTSPCASAPCLPGVQPKPPVIPPPSVAPTGTAGSDAGASSGASSVSSTGPTSAQMTQCAPLGLVTHPTTTSPGAGLARCSGDTATDGASSTETPTIVASGVASGVIAAPSVINGPQITLPAPVAHPVVPVPATTLTLAPTSEPAQTCALPAMTNALLVASCAPAITPDQATPLDSTAPVAGEE